ncbi:helix-turn-helix transcriptional regulator [Streptomyces sp. NPDC048637]|uniref:helix-turn-helix domain-containing protein n=1 Tax=Streptomyces sp. NPDC048637 TaxID=3155636 RepID=UPI0034247624
MPSLHDDHTGARIAHTRKVRRLTQRELADLAHVSYSTLTKVEQGVLPASPSVLGALARSLSVPVTELTGQPYLEELRQDQLDGLINPLRRRSTSTTSTSFSWRAVECGAAGRASRHGEPRCVTEPVTE